MDPSNYNIIYYTTTDERIGTIFGENSSSQLFQLFPNPANENIVIQSARGIDVSMLEDGVLTIYDVSGRPIKRIDNVSLAKKEKIDISNYPRGTYWIRFNNKSSLSIQKFVKM